MPYQERCCLLKWSTLEKRKEYLSLVHLWNASSRFMANGLNGLVFEFFLNIQKTSELEQTINKYKLYLN
jgi:hypothetical protein